MTSRHPWTLALLTAALLSGCPKAEAPRAPHSRPRAPAASPAIALSQQPGRFCFGLGTATGEVTITLTLLPSGELTGMAHFTTMAALEDQRGDDAFLFRGRLSGEQLTVSGRSTRDGTSRDRAERWQWKGSSLVLDSIVLPTVPCPLGR